MSGAMMSDKDCDKAAIISDFYGIDLEFAVLLLDDVLRNKVLSIMRNYNIDVFSAIQVSNNPDDKISEILSDFLRGEAINPGDPDNESPIAEAIDPSGVVVENPIEKFKRLIESEECSSLKYGCLIAPLTTIIENRSILKQMLKENPEGFIAIFDQHFIERKNTFRLVKEPITSMAMEFVMRRWH
jgi:hypothetical protein